MTAHKSAEIIPFPIRSPAFHDSIAEDPPTRLYAALAALKTALAEQHNAVAGWRTAIDSLRGSMDRLGHSLHRQNACLDTLGAGVGALGDTARQLEAQTGAILVPD